MRRTGSRRFRYALWPALLALAVLVGLTGCGTGKAARTPSDPGPGTGRNTTAPVSSPVSGRSSDAAPPAQLARSEPVRLRIPAIGVDTSVMRLGLAADHTVEVPPIAAHSPAGWYEGSPTPGRTGPAVILGHVTVGQYGDGVFRHLSAMRAGDRILVGLRDGVTASFTVDSVQTVAKSRFPTDEVYGNVDRPELRLITCGGPRDGGSGYPDNVIVYASLVR
ncbi:class F sortase [Streptomyces sp. HPF1205]|uniref:class F sortase n=1 Tax=Streptomyces sp. HPF1205 TaxID=2873262 RepID=UPI001CED702A|nr:class F sortase [Streptomyces sp. HPF1205]